MRLPNENHNLLQIKIVQEETPIVIPCINIGLTMILNEPHKKHKTNLYIIMIFDLSYRYNRM